MVSFLIETNNLIFDEYEEAYDETVDGVIFDDEDEIDAIAGIDDDTDFDDEYIDDIYDDEYIDDSYDDEDTDEYIFSNVEDDIEDIESLLYDNF